MTSQHAEVGIDPVSPKQQSEMLVLHRGVNTLLSGFSNIISGAPQGSII